ncbi:plasmid replication protein RepC [Parasulfitobacter algicola]|uniref:Replication initiation protein RepC n=1 Tax=Parasulfitobacter algicola TaxID=2614809 RepID=A0ABX2IZW5_9RHOB|nr:plasmid replication protein RepC [Sulfitobacter algicola]NSX56995.1 replication initiation protein RepC [Sulfitobacter algicola]
MQRLTTTPFGQRMISAGLLATESLAAQKPDVPQYNKWELFRNLCTARVAFGITDRDLTVLNALLTFHKPDALTEDDNLIVFPSNAALSTRAHGMAESTLRRHLAALCQAGLILRHDSPNGKRYATRGEGGELVRAFGFDLAPLLIRAMEIADAAQQAERGALALKRLREEAVLMARDVWKLIEFGMAEGIKADWQALTARLAPLQAALRRKLAHGDLMDLKPVLATLLNDVRKCFDILNETEKMSGNVARNERHYQNSNTDSCEFEPCLEKSKGVEPEVSDDPEPDMDKLPPKMPLGLILKACPDILDYAQGDIRHWHQLCATADFVRGMMGISPHAWAQSQTVMGRENAAIVLAGILQRMSQINSPGGYLRVLTHKAQDGAFSPGPMIMALLNSDQSKAA